MKYEASFLVNVTYCFFLMCVVFARMYDVRSVCVCLKVFGERYKLRWIKKLVQNYEDETGFARKVMY